MLDAMPSGSAGRAFTNWAPLLLAGTLSLLSACTPTPAVVIKLERQICLGSCPGYKLEVLESGVVKYHGTDFVAVRGEYQWSMRKEDLSALVELFAQVSCPLGSDRPEMIIDGASYYASLITDHATVEIEDSGIRECKVVLADGRTIFDAIDQATGARSFVDADSGTIPLMERAGFDFRSEAAASTLLMTLDSRRTDLARELIARGAPVVGGKSQEIFDDTYPEPALLLIPPLADIDLAKLVLEKTGPLDDGMQEHFLEASASSGCPGMMKLALEHANAKVVTASPSLLSYAVSARKYEDGTYNLERYARPDHALWVECFNPAGVVALLLNAGARVDGEMEGMTALHRVGDAASAQLLIDAGADPNVANNDEQHAPLHEVDDPGVIGVLISSGANVNQRDRMGSTPIYDKYDAESVRLLLKAGADPKVLNKAGWTPLFFINDPDVAKLLIEAGVDVNARDKDGRTALDISRDTRSVMPLLSAGARASTDAALAKIVDWATQNGRPDLVDALRKTKPLS